MTLVLIWFGALAVFFSCLYFNNGDNDDLDDF